LRTVFGMMPFLSAVVAFVVGDVATPASLSGSALLMKSYSFIPFLFPQLQF
jgi:hypothetical protein